METHRGNKYFYDRKLKRSHLCHPLLFYMLKLSNDGTALRNLIDNLGNGPIEIENCGRYSKEEIEYYYQKYLLLKESGYFSEIDQKEKLSAGIQPDTIKKTLANVKQVTFEVTDRCNLDCAYCGYGKFYWDYDQRENKNLDIRTAQRLLDYLLELWNSPMNRSHDRNIYISFYGGEPLLDFSFITKIVDYINRLDARHNRFTFSMTTNGILLEKYMDFLYENNFNLLISLDGNKNNNAYRVFKNGQPAYETILQNVKALQKKYPGYFSDRVNFNAVLHNKNSVSDIYHFFMEHFSKTPSIGALNTTGIKESQKQEFWKTYSNISESLYQSEDYSLIEKDMFVRLPNTQEVMLFLHHFNEFCFNNYNDLMYSKSDVKRVPTGTCLPFSKKIYMTVNGKILACERIGQQFDLGYVTHDRVELDFNRIAEKYNAYYDKIRKLCVACYNADVCKQCIFNLGTIDDKKPVCNGLMDEKDYSNYLSSLTGYIEEQPETYSKILKEVVIE